MICPKCGTEKIMITREDDDDEYTYRRFYCVECGHVWNARRKKEVFEPW